ncbi:MAG: NUDIX hydrolase, partial [Actinobacteria bacterium]|nr:NUDIX hydrolase [Actinomycetota bacterium]
MADPQWRDSAGKRLVDYPRPSVAVDVAVLTVVPGEELSPSRRWSEPGILAVLVHRLPTGEWALPGTFLHEGERLADAVARALHDKLGLDGVTPHQLRVFDDPTRDPRGW